MNTLHIINQASMLAALEAQVEEEKESIGYNLAVTGDWNGEGRIDFGAPSGSSTGPFRDINSFSFVATSTFGTTEFTTLDLSFAYWNVGSSGLMIGFSVLTVPVRGFSLSIHLGQEAAKLEGRKFATVEAGTLTHSSAQPVARAQRDYIKQRWTAVPVLREV